MSSLLRWSCSFVLIALAGVASAAPRVDLWWEAEAFARGNFPANHGFAPADARQADVLSGGAWIGASAPRPGALYAEYEIDVPADGAYAFYARKFWKHGPFRWRFDDQPWRECGPDVALLDAVELRLHTVANWVGLGPVELAAGRRTLRIELLENEGAAAFDCFLLTSGDFSPRGRLRPGESYGRSEPEWFAFEPAPDPYDDSPIDLRRLNERFAGELGRIRAQGQSFVQGEPARPVRFWAVNAGPDVARMDHPSVDALARLLAKRGVNLVRVHGRVWADDDLAKVDPGMLDGLHYFVHAMKQQGIYTCVSFYFPLWINMDAQRHGFAGYRGNHPFALLFFSEPFQDLHRGWLRDVLTSDNPHTGLTLSADPAVAMVEILNEDSYFFWTFEPYERVPGEQMATLERRFGAWLAARHGSVDAALRAFGGEKVRGDEPGDGRAGLLSAGALAFRRDRRAQETARFLTEEQTEFFRRTRAYIRDELGFSGLVYGSNWVTANAGILGPLDKHSNTVCDFMDRHGYAGPPHEGPRASYSLSAGDRYDDQSALHLRRYGSDEPATGLPLFDIVYNDLPSTISEVNWTTPNRFRADLPLAAAAYGALQGTDSIMFFALSGPAWLGMHTKFPVQTPVTLGQFPAAALVYRQGLIREADAVFRAELKLDDLFALKGQPVPVPQNLDEMRAADVPPGQALTSESITSVDPLAFLVGRVEMNITEAGGASKAVNLAPYIDRDARMARSATGELTWDWGRGLVTIAAPAAQGATGFLRDAGAIDLPDATLEIENEYGAAMLVALDGAPLATSKRILLQVASEDRNYGFEAPGQGMREIVSLGAPPILVREMAGVVRLKAADAARVRATALDPNGYPAGDAGSADRLTLRPDVMYYLLTREGD